MVLELLALVRMDLLGPGKSVDPSIEDGLGNGVGLLVWQGHEGGNLGKCVRDGQDILVVGVGLEGTHQVDVDPLIRSVLYWQRFE